jgi:hypothetical protein
MPRRGMARDPLSWIGERSEEASLAGPAAQREGEERGQARGAGPAAEFGTSELPKFATLIPITARLTEEQLSFLDTLERRIMRSRRRRHERITKNSIIRAAIELLMALDLDVHDIADEEELKQRLLASAGLSLPPPGPAQATRPAAATTLPPAG